MSSSAWASASWRRWPTIPRAMSISRAWTRRTCLRRARPALPCVAACICAAMSTISSRASRRRSIALPSTLRSPAVRTKTNPNKLRRDETEPRVTAPRRSWSLAALLASLAMLGTFSVDMYLPAFPAIEADLRATPLELQQTLSTYMVAYAFMMLWHGSLSDALGRRAVVLAGLLVYSIASLGCAIAGNIESLWLFRTLQGICAGSGLVVGRAIIRDRFHGPEAQRLMSQITMVFGIAPALAPIVGGTLLNLLGWRSIFWMLFVVVAALLGWAA